MVYNNFSDSGECMATTTEDMNADFLNRVEQMYDFVKGMGEDLKIKRFFSTLDEMTEIAKREVQNAKDTIPLVEYDSRLGYEPSMEYMCDKAHLDWKIAVVERIINEEIPRRRASREFGKLNTKNIFAGGRNDME